MKKYFLILFLVVFIAFIFHKLALGAFALQVDKPGSLGTKNNQKDNSISKQAEDKRSNILENVLRNLFGDGNSNLPGNSVLPNPSPGNGSPIPTQTPGGLPINQTFSKLDQLYDYVGNKTYVPPCVLKAISHIEYPTAYNYTAEEVERFQQPGQVIKNCPWNSCSAKGHMQMTIGVDERGSRACNRCCWQGNCLSSCPDAWTPYGNAVKQFEGVTYTPDACNLLDSTYGAAKKLKNDSGTAAGNMNWTAEQYYRAGKRYYGNCTVPYARLGIRTYCQFVQYSCNL